MCESAIVLIIFNRPENTKKILEQIFIAKPAKLYIIADAARENEKEELELTIKCKELIDKIQWKCEVKKNYALQNMGCGLRISSGLDWVFSNEDSAIILEDDCVPAQSFFTFCDQMLHKYKNSTSIYHISGTRWNEEKKTDEDYLFSRYAHVWGWATWKRAWQQYDYSLSKWPEAKKLENYKLVFQSENEYIFWNSKFQKMFLAENKSTWDYQWQFTIAINQGLCVTPAKNLINNIGIDGTHLNIKTGTSSFYFNRKVDEQFTVTKHPEILTYDNVYDKYHFRKHFYNSTAKKIKKKLIAIFKKLNLFFSF